MKNIKYLILLLIGLSIMAGCSKLEEKPVGLLSPDGFFQSVDDIQTAVDGSLTHAINEEIWGRKLSIALLLRSDMVDLQSSQTRRVEMNMHTISGNNEMVSDPWKRIYMGIAAANNAISGAEEVEADAARKNPVVAQAYFARAFYYFHLVRLFDQVPYMDENTGAEEAFDLTLSTEAEVYEKILADLAYAKEWLPDVVTSRAMPSKAAASSYIALVHLTRGDYQEAWTEAKEVIDNAGKYNLALDPDFQTLFDADRIDASPEPIFALDYNNYEAPDNAYDQTAPMTGIRGDLPDQGWSVAVPSYNVYLSFDTLDYRTRVSFQTESTIKVTIDDPDNPGETIEVDSTVQYDNFAISGHEHAANWPYIAKYTRYPGPYARGNKRATSHNYSMLRYAELLLIAAEAAVELGDNGSALMYINEVRARARQGGESTNGGYVEETIDPSDYPMDLTGTVTVADVLEERRIELAFEGKRWYDIKRRKLGDELFSASGYEGAKPDWNSSVDYHTPIPDEEIERNPNLAGL